MVRPATGDATGIRPGSLMTNGLPAPLVEEEHDRHRGNFSATTPTGAINDPVKRPAVDTSFSVGHPSHHGTSMRQSESRDTVLLHHSELEALQADVPLIRIHQDGKVHHHIPIEGNIIGVKNEAAP